MCWNGTSWEQKGTATTVGHKRILKIAETTTDKLRIRITQSRMEPTLANVALYKSATLLTSPSIANRDSQGKVLITAGGGDTIYYTIDGSEPTTASSIYSAAIDLPLGGTVKAIARNGSSESFASIRIFSGLVPTGWQVIAVSSEEAGAEPAINAIDDDPDTIWHTDWAGADAHPHHITIDMQSSRWIGGFSYLPRGDGPQAGVVKNYRFEVSEDNSAWTNVSEAEFLNIQNNPVLQTVNFANPVRARYFRYTALDEVNASNFASAAEINVLPSGYDAFRQSLGLQTAPVTEDFDEDGLGLLMEYYLGTDLTTRTTNPTAIQLASGNPDFKVLRKTGVNDVTATVRYSHNLVDWFDATPITTTSVDQGDGTSLDTYTMPLNGHSIFYRLHVSQ